MKSIFFSVLSCLLSLALVAQSSHHPESLKSELDTLNRQLDHWVVQKNVAQLQKHYADHFVFTHGTGQVDSKESWLKSVARPGSQYQSRLHDSTAVELHPNLAIVTGTLTVLRNTDKPNSNYGIRYVRVYTKPKDVWQLASHRTVLQWRF